MNEVTREKLAEDFKTVFEDVRELLRITASHSGETVAKLRERLWKKLVEGKNSINGHETGAFEKANKAGSLTTTYVRENPWTALAIGAGICLVLGLLLRRD
jgi:ElaB/YqjD/DUF883 family membrane-anchored ribosome-binding protein